MTKNTKFTRCTIEPNIEQLNPKTYRARVSLNGTRYSNKLTSLTKARKWVKMVKQTGNPKVTV